MTFACDEGPGLGGLGSAPTMRMRVTARNRVDGSVLNDSVEAQMVGAETTLEHHHRPAQRDPARGPVTTSRGSGRG